MKTCIKLTVTMLMLLIFAGCATTSPEYSIGVSGAVNVADDLTSEYEGVGLVKLNNGSVKTSFRAHMTGYEENGIIFMRETFSYEDGEEREFTYRLTPSDSGLAYGCVRIETLDSCSLTAAGNTIEISSRRMTYDFMQAKYLYTRNLYHFMGEGRLIRHTYFNKLMFLHDATEIVHYTKVN